jgi:predicted enzyme related to lactoylglutathione lyase
MGQLVSASHAITRFVLRTTDVPAARSFYAALLGHDRFSVVPLHEQALARGARPHWLGQIEVDDVESSVRAFVEHGAQALNPIAAFPDGRRFAVLRDPGGAIVGLTSPGPLDESPAIVWHQLSTNDRARVEKAYTTVFGWRLTDIVMHPEHGEFQNFAWPGKEGDAGAIVDITGRPERHAGWLFYRASATSIAQSRRCVRPVASCWARSRCLVASASQCATTRRAQHLRCAASWRD